MCSPKLNPLIVSGMFFKQHRGVPPRAKSSFVSTIEKRLVFLFLSLIFILLRKDHFKCAFCRRLTLSLFSLNTFVKNRATAKVHRRGRLGRMYNIVWDKVMPIITQLEVLDQAQSIMGNPQNYAKKQTIGGGNPPQPFAAQPFGQSASGSEYRRGRVRARRVRVTTTTTKSLRRRRRWSWWRKPKRRRR